MCSRDENEYPEPSSYHDCETLDHVYDPENEGRSNDSQGEESGDGNRQVGLIDSARLLDDDNNSVLSYYRSIATDDVFL